jgi:hypothetical protein
MSMVLGDKLLGAGRDPREALAGLTDFALVEVEAGFLRDTCRQAVYPKPTSAEPAHGEVEGRKTDSVRSKIAKKATWVIKPRQCCLRASTGSDCPTCMAP